MTHHFTTGGEQGGTRPSDFGQGGLGSGDPGDPGQCPALCPMFGHGTCLESSFSSPVPALPLGPTSRRVCFSDAHGAQHHASGPQRVAGALEVVPADAIELAHVVASWVVDAVEIREAAGVKPPSWGRERDMLGEVGASQWAEGSPPPEGFIRAAASSGKPVLRGWGPVSRAWGQQGDSQTLCSSLQPLKAAPQKPPACDSVSLGLHLMSLSLSLWSVFPCLSWSVSHILCPSVFIYLPFWTSIPTELSVSTAPCLYILPFLSLTSVLPKEHRWNQGWWRAAPCSPAQVSPSWSRSAWEADS